MNTWTDISTLIGSLLTLATTAVNLAATLHTRPRHSQQDQHRGGQKPDGG